MYYSWRLAATSFGPVTSSGLLFKSNGSLVTLIGHLVKSFGVFFISSRIFVTSSSLLFSSSAILFRSNGLLVIVFGRLVKSFGVFFISFPIFVTSSGITAFRLYSSLFSIISKELRCCLTQTLRGWPMLCLLRRPLSFFGRTLGFGVFKYYRRPY